MSTAIQTSLFDAAPEVAHGSLSAGLTRQELGRGAWVDVFPGWMTGVDALFATLLSTVDWIEERRQMYERVVLVPRLLRFYGEDEILPDPALTRARDALSAHYEPELGEPFRTAGMCLYRDGRDSVAWHGDTIGRNFLLRPRGGGVTIKHQVGHGDLLVMGGSCQRTWEHSVPKTARPVGPRISIQFRPRGVR